MADEKPKGRPTRLRIASCNQVYVGKNTRGDEYTIYEVEAYKADGTQVKEKLNSFENLPLEVLELTVTPYRSAKHGLSYTLSRRSRPNRDQQVTELRELIEALTVRVAALEGEKKRLSLEDDPDLKPSFGDIPI